MLKRAKDIIDSTDGKIAAGVSGGADSMCLISLVLASKKGKDVTVLNIDHGIRQSSDSDSRLVEDFCKKNDIKFVGYKIDVPLFAKQSGRSIETEARIMRHNIFKEYCLQNNTKLMLAHNYDDNIESVLMHIFRGCGIRGLRGMSAVTEGEIAVIRPLIFTPKSEIYRYVRQNNIPFAEDETNSDISYRRNHIRAIMPELEKSFPSIKSAITSLSLIAAQTDEYIGSQLNPDYIKKEKSALSNAVLLDKRAVSGYLAGEYIFRAACDAGLKIDLEQKHIDAIIKLSMLENGKTVCLPHGLRVYNEYDHLAFELERKITGGEMDFLEGASVLGDVGVLAYATSLKPTSNRLIADADVLEGAKIRFRRDGDRFCPYKGNTKKLKEYFNEKQVPLRIRDRIPLIADGNEVLVIPDIEISDKVKITDKTTRALEIKLY